MAYIDTILLVPLKKLCENLLAPVFRVAICAVCPLNELDKMHFFQ